MTTILKLPHNADTLESSVKLHIIIHNEFNNVYLKGTTF